MGQRVRPDPTWPSSSEMQGLPEHCPRLPAQQEGGVKALGESQERGTPCQVGCHTPAPGKSAGALLGQDGRPKSQLSCFSRL